jgi:uncharacterized membrane protein
MNRTRIALAILTADLIATVVLYARLPLTVPVHWGLRGADGFGPRWAMVALGPGLLVVFWLLLLWLTRIDPLASKPLEPDAPEAEQGSFGTLMTGLVGLSAIAHIALMMQLTGFAHLDPRLGMLFGPALLILLGNFLPRVRPNYFAGVRTPWTLASASVWRRTNRLAGKLLFYGGLFSGLLMLASNPAGTVALVVSGLLGSVVPIAASYIWWRNEQTR